MPLADLYETTRLSYYALRDRGYKVSLMTDSYGISDGFRAIHKTKEFRFRVREWVGEYSISVELPDRLGWSNRQTWSPTTVPSDVFKSTDTTPTEEQADSIIAYLHKQAEESKQRVIDMEEVVSKDHNWMRKTASLILEDILNPTLETGSRITEADLKNLLKLQRAYHTIDPFKEVDEVDQSNT